MYYSEKNSDYCFHKYLGIFFDENIKLLLVIINYNNGDKYYCV